MNLMSLGGERLWPGPLRRTVWCQAQARWQTMPRIGDGERALSDARRSQHRPTHARGAGALAQGALAARILLRRGSGAASQSKGNGAYPSRSVTGPDMRASTPVEFQVKPLI